MSMCQNCTDNSKVNRELKCWIEIGSFDKQELEMAIISWMPYEVSDPCQLSM